MFVILAQISRFNQDYVIRVAIVINHKVKLGNIPQQGGGGSRQNQKNSNPPFEF